MAARPFSVTPRRMIRSPTTKYRRQMKKRFYRHVDGHRWHIEAAISQNKRRLGSALYSRNDASRESECLLRILKWAALGFQQSMNLS